MSDDEKLTPKQRSNIRTPSEMSITSDWIHHHADGPQGIEQEITERAKHAKPVFNPASTPTQKESVK